MPAKKTLLIACLLSVLPGAGCSRQGLNPAGQREQIVPAGVAGTIGEYAFLVGGEPMPVRGWGVVVGLGKNGSSEVPATLRKYLMQQMSTYGVGSLIEGMGNVRPERVLEDKDTAVVSVVGYVPPAATEGTRFDVFVEALPQSQTLSLDGGCLMGTELRMAEAVGLPRFTEARVWGMAGGAVFVNPFAERPDQVDQARLRSGLIPGGGVLRLARPVRLELRRADYFLADQIARRINQRFSLRDEVGIARNPTLVDLKIPPAYKDDCLHFIDLVMHIYLAQEPGGQEAQARRLQRAVLLPTAHPEDIALCWEAMGRQVVPILRDLYASDNAAAAYYSARTGLRLEDALAVEPMARFAGQSGSEFQIPAVRELGNARRYVQVVPLLKGLLSSSSDLVRVAAYEALAKHGGGAVVSSTSVSGQFRLDVVEGQREYTIYATRSGEPRIVLFGHNLSLRRPVFYCPADELVTLHADTPDAPIRADRKIPRTGRRSDTMEVAPRVADLVRVLGSLPDMDDQGKIEGLGLTYSQVAGVLHALCRNGDIPAKFVLQPSAEVQRMYPASSAGRPDMPPEGQ